MIWIRSFLFHVFFYLGIIVYGSAIVLVWPVTPLTWRQAMARSWGRYNRRLLGVVCHLRDRIVGLEHLPPPPFVILAKHQSAWETIVFLGIFPPFVWALKAGLKWIPFFGWALQAVDEIFIDRSRGLESMKKLQEESRKHFSRGVGLLVFPEGTRVMPGTVGEYKAGGINVAMAANLPIVPVAHNAGRFWPRNGFLKRPGVIQLRIGAPIPTVGLPPAARKALLRQVQETIEGMMEEIEREAEQPQ